MNPPLKLSGIVLAAGLSRRAGPVNKLLVAVDGQPVVRRVAAAFCEAGLNEVLVVTGHQNSLVKAALAGLPVRFVAATDYQLGIAHSLAAGVRACRADTSGFLVSPSDLPALHSGVIRSVAERFAALKGERHVVPTANGQRGHPVAIGAWLRPQLERLTGDQGAKSLLASDTERARCDFLEVGDAAIHTDNDTGRVSG